MGLIQLYKKSLISHLSCVFDCKIKYVHRDDNLS